MRAATSVDRLVDAALDAERQAVAGRVDRVDRARGSSPSRIAHDVQDRPEHFARRAAAESSISISVGATKVPCAHAGRQRQREDRARRGARHCATCASSCARASSSITGPTSVARRRGSPMRSSSIAPRSIGSDAIGDVVLQAQHAQRRAALARAVERRREHVGHHLLGQRGAVDDHRVLAAGLGDRAPDRRARGASARSMSRATSVEPVNSTPAMRGSATSAAPTVSPRPGSNCSAAGGTPARCKRRTAAAAISGVCSAGFASTGLPAASAALTWPDEDRERKIPRRDAGDRPARRRARAARAAPAPRSSGRNRRPRALRPAHWAASCPPRAPPAASARARFALEQIGGALEARRARSAAAARDQAAPSRRRHARPRARRPPRRLPRPCRRRRGGRRIDDRRRARAARRGGASASIGAAMTGAAGAPISASSSRSDRSSAKSRPREFRRSGIQRDGQRNARMRRAAGRARARDRIGDEVGDGDRRDRRCG